MMNKKKKKRPTNDRANVWCVCVCVYSTGSLPPFTSATKFQALSSFFFLFFFSGAARGPNWLCLATGLMRPAGQKWFEFFIWINFLKFTFNSFFFSGAARGPNWLCLATGLMRPAGRKWFDFFILINFF